MYGTCGCQKISTGVFFPLQRVPRHHCRAEGIRRGCWACLLGMVTQRTCNVWVVLWFPSWLISSTPAELAQACAVRRVGRQQVCCWAWPNATAKEQGPCVTLHRCRTAPLCALCQCFTTSTYSTPVLLFQGTLPLTQHPENCPWITLEEDRLSKPQFLSPISSLF